MKVINIRCEQIVLKGTNMDTFDSSITSVLAVFVLANSSIFLKRSVSFRIIKN